VEFEPERSSDAADVLIVVHGMFHVKQDVEVAPTISPLGSGAMPSEGTVRRDG
jgi:hypothetical protein